MPKSHTPGPWTVFEERRIYGPNNGDELIAEVTDTAEGMEGSDATADANAILIATAPDMLAALEKFVTINRANGYEFDSNEPNLYQEIVAAIAKAKGN